MSLGEQTSNF